MKLTRPQPPKGIGADITPRTQAAPRLPVYRPIPPDIRPVRRRPAPPAVAPAVAAPTPAPHQPAPAESARAGAPSQRASWWALAQYPLIAVGALAAAFNATAGQALVGLFALYVIIRRPGSRLSFGVALFILLTIPLFQVLGRDGIAENAAIYVYELLVIGTISALFELRKTPEPPA